MYVCNCSNQVGGWSTKGLVLDESLSDETSVTCLTQHLTSFAVLVKISGTDETQVRAKRSFVKIGCYCYTLAIYTIR